MVNRNLLRQYELADDEMLQELNAAFDQDVTKKWLPDQEQEFEVNKIITGKVLNVVGEEVWVDVDIENLDRKSTRLNSSHITISYAVFCLKKKKKTPK